MVIPLFVERPKSIKALEAAMDAAKASCWWRRKTPAKDEPSAEDIYSIGLYREHPADLKLPDDGEGAWSRVSQRVGTIHDDHDGPCTSLRR